MRFFTLSRICEPLQEINVKANNVDSVFGFIPVIGEGNGSVRLLSTTSEEAGTLNAPIAILKTDNEEHSTESAAIWVWNAERIKKIVGGEIYFTHKYYALVILEAGGWLEVDTDSVRGWSHTYWWKNDVMESMATKEFLQTRSLFVSPLLEKTKF